MSDRLTDEQIADGLRLAGAADGALEGVGRYLSFHGADHDDDCPGDDTCDCSQKPLNDGVNQGFQALTQMATHYAVALAEVQALREQVKVSRNSHAQAKEER